MPILGQSPPYFRSRDKRRSVVSKSRSRSPPRSDISFVAFTIWFENCWRCVQDTFNLDDQVNDFVCQVCAGASAEPRTGHSNTEGDPEGAGDGGGGEGDQARCKES